MSTLDTPENPDPPDNLDPLDTLETLDTPETLKTLQPLLQTIAKAYTKRYADLKGVCFLFPNKRCGIFLKRYLAEAGLKGEDMPHILTISEFAAMIARKTEANRIVQLFTLFNAYLEVTGDSDVIDFDSFRGWGETVLSDFNIVDLYLADPEEVFKNVKDYRELTTNFLTEEQTEVMREFFGVESTGDPRDFWKTFPDPANISSVQQKFLSLWQVLAPLHKKFIGALEEKGLGTVGSINRLAAEQLKAKGKEALPYKKMVITGFNALNEAERQIFKTLKDIDGTPGYDDFADFIWDATGTVLEGEDFTASKFVNFNRKHFPSPEWLGDSLKESATDSYPEIEIISSPSLTAQTKVAGELLKQYASPESRKMVADAEVALIMPDESLLPNMLFSFPEDIGDINLTMGYSMRQTPVASFVSLIRRIYASSGESNESRQFFSRDLKMFFTHPYSYILFEGQEIAALLEHISKNHLIRVDLKEIGEFIPSASELLKFPSKKEKNGGEIFQALYEIFRVILEKLEEGKETEGKTEDEAQISVYLDYLRSLDETVKIYDIDSSPLSLMQMADRIIAAEKIGFAGEPLSGLQVMGTLESRVLDFRHVIILSMNEGIMPRRAMGSTFIPETLRKAYGLPPARYAEEIFGYYFYRLLSRAEKVTLIYDGRTVSGMRGGVSRYILQLRQFAPKESIKESSWQFRLQTHEQNISAIPKTPEIREMIKEFSLPGVNGRNLSASSLNNFRECQVKFFYRNVLNLNPDPERGEYMDAIEVGNVLHAVMMELYLPDPADRERLLETPKVVSREFLQNLLDNTRLIRRKVEENILELYYGNRERGAIDSGVTNIIADQIAELVEEIIRYDMGLTPFLLWGCEISENMRVKLKSSKTLNFRFAIDRLDEIKVEGRSRLRIVDYKTGSRKRNADSLEDVFEGGYRSEQIFQLFTYAWLLKRLGVKNSDDVITEIYYVPDLIIGKGGLPEIGRQPVRSFAEYSEEFSDRMENMLEGLMEDPEFGLPSDPDACRLCPFRSLCLS